MYTPHPMLSPGTPAPGTFEQQAHYDAMGAAPILGIDAVNQALWDAQRYGNPAVFAAAHGLNGHAQYAATTMTGRGLLPVVRGHTPSSTLGAVGYMDTARCVLPTPDPLLTRLHNKDGGIPYMSEHLLPPDDQPVQIAETITNTPFRQLSFAELFSNAQEGALPPDTVMWWPGLSSVIAIHKHRAFNFRVLQARYDSTSAHRTEQYRRSRLETGRHPISESLGEERILSQSPISWLPDGMTKALVCDADGTVYGVHHVRWLIQLAAGGELSPLAQVRWKNRSSWLPIFEPSAFNAAIWRVMNQDFSKKSH